MYKDIWAPAIGDERGTILPKSRVLRGVGVKYSMSVFFFGFGGPSSLSLKMIVNAGSSSQSGPCVSTTNSTELPSKRGGSGDDSRSLNSIVAPKRK